MKRKKYIVRRMSIFNLSHLKSKSKVKFFRVDYENYFKIISLFDNYFKNEIHFDWTDWLTRKQEFFSWYAFTLFMTFVNCTAYVTFYKWMFILRKYCYLYYDFHYISVTFYLYLHTKEYFVHFSLIPLHIN